MQVLFKTTDLEQLYLIPVENIKGKLPFQKSFSSTVQKQNKASGIN